MPYLRTIRYASPVVAWHDIVLTEAAPAWSSAYRADSPRLLVPGSRWIEVEKQGRRFVCDALSPLQLTPEVPYRMRQPFEGQRSVLLVFDVADVAAAARPRLGLAAHWALVRWRAALDTGVFDRLAFEEDVVALWPPATTDAQHLSGEASARARRAVERARERLADDPASNAPLHELAHDAAYSPFQLARTFRQVNGVGLHGYRIRLRMVLALARLAQGEDDLTQLALELGYSSHSHFSAAFRAHVGTTPSAARRGLRAPSTTGTGAARASSAGAGIR